MLKHRQKLALRDIRALQYGLDEIRLAGEAYDKALEPIQRLLDLMDHEPAEGKCTLKELLDDIMPLAEKLALSKGKGGLRLQWDCEGEVQLSRSLAEALSKSLIHLVRNTIDHGLEMPEKRTQKNKPAQGTFRVFRDAQGRICFQDDGGGLSQSKLRRKAQELGLSPANGRELCELIFVKGLSTADKVDQDAGRGIGMDAVRMFLREADADLEIVPLHEDGDAIFFYFAILASV
jgi:two-component system chemotaxis sensor kinase CheA